jgi:hypothetical protein
MSTLTQETKTSVKVIGANGQISLGKDYAGRQVLVEECEPGVWFVRTAIVIPENERWLHEPKAAASLQAAMEWTVKNKPKETDLNTLPDGINHGQQPAKSARQARPQQPRVSKKLAGTR